VQAIGAYLRCLDVLTARGTCTQWADALAASVTQLRIPLVSNPNPTPLRQLQDTSAAGSRLTDAAQHLTAGLERFPRVHSVTLLLSPDTSSQDLQQALRVVGCKVGGLDKLAQVFSRGCASYFRRLPHQQKLLQMPANICSSVACPACDLCVASITSLMTAVVSSAMRGLCVLLSTVVLLCLQPGITTVYICEVPSPLGPSPADRYGRQQYRFCHSML
jgi:hypothetical protein